MSFSFNEAEEQREFVAGPVPAGSTVLLKMKLQKARPEYAAKPDSFVSRTQSGMLQMNVKFTVQAGTYNGYHWFENMSLPVGMQRGVELKEGQKRACNISYSKMRAILESVRGIDPKEKSPRASKARSIDDMMEFDGMVFPARLGIRKTPRIGTDRNGNQREYWDNQLGFVLPVTHADYALIKNGGEVITDGPTKGESQPAQDHHYDNGDYNAAPQAPVPGWDEPPMDDGDMPF